MTDINAEAPLSKITYAERIAKGLEVGSFKNAIQLVMNEIQERLDNLESMATTSAKESTTLPRTTTMLTRYTTLPTTHYEAVVKLLTPVALQKELYPEDTLARLLRQIKSSAAIIDAVKAYAMEGGNAEQFMHRIIHKVANIKTAEIVESLIPLAEQASQENDTTLPDVVDINGDPIRIGSVVKLPEDIEPKELYAVVDILPGGTVELRWVHPVGVHIPKIVLSVHRHPSECLCVVE